MNKEAFNSDTYRGKIVELYSGMSSFELSGERMFINRAYQVQKAGGKLSRDREEAFQIRLEVLTEMITGGKGVPGDPKTGLSGKLEAEFDALLRKSDSNRKPFILPGLPGSEE